MDVNAFVKQGLDALYTDSADISRAINEPKPDGSTVTRFVPVLQDVKCRLSRAMSRKDTIDDDGPASVVDSEAMLYYALDTEILPGDRVKVSREGKTWDYVAAEAHNQYTHCELRLKRTVDA